MQTHTLNNIDTATDYLISCITNNYRNDIYIDKWRSLLAQSRSCEKIYQSPEFFHYLTKSRHRGSDRFELFSVSDNKDCLVGILPLRWSSINLDFRLGSFVVYSYRVNVIRLLGSLPMLGDCAELRNKIMKAVLDLFPEQGSIMLQSCPIEEKEILQPNNMIGLSVLYGWRTCHTIPIPDAFETYLRNMSAKRRYNTSREIRHLTKALGKLCLMRVDGPANVAQLFECLTAIKPGTEGTIDENDYTAFAENNICLSYALAAGGEWIAAVMGSRFEDTWHVHRIHFSCKYRQLSAGSVAMHLAVEDVIQNFSFAKIDFGFGSPTYKFTSTHKLQKRASILISRKYSRMNLIISSFVTYDKFHSILANWVIIVCEKAQAGIRRIASILPLR